MCHPLSLLEEWRKNKLSFEIIVLLSLVLWDYCSLISRSFKIIVLLSHCPLRLLFCCLCPVRLLFCCPSVLNSTCLFYFPQLSSRSYRASACHDTQRPHSWIHLKLVVVAAVVSLHSCCRFWMWCGDNFSCIKYVDEWECTTFVSLCL